MDNTNSSVRSEEMTRMCRNSAVRTSRRAVTNSGRERSSTSVSTMMIRDGLYLMNSAAALPEEKRAQLV